MVEEFGFVRGGDGVVNKLRVVPLLALLAVREGGEGRVVCGKGKRKLKERGGSDRRSSMAEGLITEEKAK